MRLPQPAAALRRTRRISGSIALVTLVAVGVSSTGSQSSTAARDAVALSTKDVNPVTPGDFTGYGFDQCHTPDQKTMNTWRKYSPFTAVGVYISGNSRFCRDQPNLTADWVTKQQAKGWRILPITLGPQASCNPRFPRYDDDPVISPKPGSDKSYPNAADQGVAEAQDAVNVARSLGISSGSTLWYDLEGFNADNTKCRESSLRFVSSWTETIRQLGYVSGVYSSAGSGLSALDDARVNRPGTYTMPDQIWIARWDGRADTTTSYLRSDGWTPGGRMKQYQGGHDETWGGVRINIDRNFLNLGAGSVAEPEEMPCGGIRINYSDYPTLTPPTTAEDGTRTVADPDLVKALQCLLTNAGLYSGELNGTYNNRTIKAANAWQTKTCAKVKPNFGRADWVSLLASGPHNPQKRGSTGPQVRRIQRALNAMSASVKVKITGVYTIGTEKAVAAWQDKHGMTVSGIVTAPDWAALRKGQR